MTAADLAASVQTAVPWIGLAVFSAYLGLAALGDIQRYTITDRLNLFGLVAFLTLAMPMGMSLEQVGAHVAAGLAATVFALLVFWIGGFGGGDAKMIAAMAFWIGPAPMYEFVVATALAGGLLGLILLAGRHTARHTGLPKGPRWLRKILRRGSGVPYGVALAAGGLFVAPFTIWYPQSSPF